MFKIKVLCFSLLALSACTTMNVYAGPTTLKNMTDEQLSETTGQALMSLSYIAPSDVANLEAKRVGGDNKIGFYKLGMEAELELNTNIKKLQLGCGGVNGAGGCDIDIDNLSLSGISSTRDGRVGSSAKITNPFIEFAVKNPTSASQREIVGLRLSAEKILGLLTTGVENSSTPSGINTLSGYMKIASDSTADNIKGQLNTAPGYLDAGWYFNNAGKKYDDGSTIEPLQGSMSAAGIASSDFKVNGGGFWIPGVKDVKFTAQLSTLRGMKADGTLINGGGKINGNRIVGVQIVPNTVVLPNAILGFNPDGNSSSTNNNDQKCAVLGSASCNQFGVTSGFVSSSVYTTDANGNYTNPAAYQSVNDVLKTQGGLVTALTYNCSALGLIPCDWLGIEEGKTQFDVKMFGKISGLKADVTFQEKLGFIHALEVNSAASLSLQKQNIQWTNAKSDDVAQRGWWLSMSDPVYVGDLLPSNAVSLCPGGMTSISGCAYPQFIKQANEFFKTNKAETSDLGSMLGRTAPLAVLINDPKNANGVALNGFNLTISDLQLATQHFAPNCYGSLKFC
ncbi:hypothetical protein EXE10_14635 [Acinetobacter sp. WCHAc060033]|uniref:hypothetical protein n=1 Tax=Acinetobacter sp. WCHAc060033 TaxID=2518624 RepID=UPI0010232FF3|nr:hypothetical protein [Acinetobacter sp. WCHAc060033]RZG80111.1 hypothetical protein EXE10_14635 [Acinetobacter sp. WCHAc060033]